MYSPNRDFSLFDLAGEVDQALELVAELGQDLGSGRVVGPSTAGFAIANSRVDEGFEMMTHGGLSQAQVMFQVKHTYGPVGNGEEMENLDALWVTQRLADLGQPIS